MHKRYVVRLSDEERSTCEEVIKNLKGSSQKARRARILLKAGDRHEEVDHVGARKLTTWGL